MSQDEIDALMRYEKKNKVDRGESRETRHLHLAKRYNCKHPQII